MKRGWQIFWHVFFWVATISFFVLVVHNNSKMSWEKVLVIFGLFGLVNIGLFYLNFLFYIPKFLDKRKFKAYAIVLVITVVALGVAKYGLATLFRPYILNENGRTTTFGLYFINTLLASLIFVFLSTFLKVTMDWFLNERIQQDLENQRLTAELSFLKSQINPHFLFNSLNTIYSLAYQKSDTTPDAVLKLSEIMRYMLYESNDNKVDLDKELKYLQNYIDLQKIRFGDNAFIEYTVDGTVDHQRIVPLILISFVENAFKHGVANDPEHPIILAMHVTPEKLNFYVHNKKHQHNRDAAGGIGLNNVRRRLNLLYPGKYKLSIQNEPDTYSCELSLIL